MQADDHIQGATWLGKPLNLKLDGLARIQKELVEKLDAGANENELLWDTIYN